MQQHKNEFVLLEMAASIAIYDSFFELAPTVLKRLAPHLQELDLTLDVHVTKPAHLLQTEWVVTSQPAQQTLYSVTLQQRPIEANLFEVALMQMGAGLAVARQETVRRDRWADWQRTYRLDRYYRRERPAGRLPGRWGWLRYLHFGLSLGLVALAWFGFGFRAGAVGRSAVLWYGAGNLAYYALGIGLAYALKDNRAFCKYICPVTVPLKLTSRFALLKIKGEAASCNDCGACTLMCPMDIRIPDYILQGQRVLSTECTLCQTCVSVCARDALSVSFGLDLGGPEKLRLRER